MPAGSDSLALGAEEARVVVALETRNLEGSRLLVVEDEYLIASDISRELNLCGAEVVGPAASLGAALALLAQEKIDAAVLDLKLGSEMAFPLIAVLQMRHIPFVFVTGYSRRDIPLSYRDVPLWQKPLEYARFVEALPALLANGKSSVRGGRCGSPPLA
jgi:DNA-binding response OmpR family regulator